MTVADRLLKKYEVNESGCWDWQGAIKPSGYGQITVGSRTDGSRKNVTAHRAAYEAFNGRIGSAWVLHRCDNPRCINPRHLYLGDRRQNTKDAIDRDRYPSTVGERNGNAKIKEHMARNIKFLRSRNCSCGDIADGFGISINIVKEISSGRTWSHIPEPPESDNESQSI